MYSSCTRIYVLTIPTIDFTLRILAACRRGPREDAQSRDAWPRQVDPLTDMPPASYGTYASSGDGTR